MPPTPMTRATGVLLAVAMLGVVAQGRQEPSSRDLLSEFKNATVFWQQFEVARELADAGDPRVLKALEPWLVLEDRHLRGNAALESQIRADRYYAVHLLGKLRAPRAIAMLTPLVNDKDVGDKAAWALDQIRASADDHPRVQPFFSTVTGGPAFFVECTNTTGTTFPSGARTWASEIRVDGKALPNDNGTIGGGLTTSIAAGGDWRGIIVLRGSPGDYFPSVKFGAHARITRVVRLAPGRHAFAVKCGDAWSADTPFYWESERQ